MNVYKQIEQAILKASNIVITAHKSADGDSVGCSLGLLHFIEKLGKKATICHPDQAPAYLHWLDTSPILLMSEVILTTSKSLTLVQKIRSSTMRLRHCDNGNTPLQTTQMKYIAFS